MLACHFELLLDLMMFPNHWENLTDPLVSMWKPSGCWKMMTIPVRQEVRSCPLYKYLSSHLGSIVEFHSFSTHMKIRVLSKAYEAIESLAFQRVIALLRTERYHEQKLVLPRLFALHPVAVRRLWCFGSSQSIHCI